MGRTLARCLYASEGRVAWEGGPGGGGGTCGTRDVLLAYGLDCQHINCQQLFAQGYTFEGGGRGGREGGGGAADC